MAFYRLQKNKKGFTLVELLVTIAIMAVIIGMGAPSISSSVSRRKTQAAENDAQEIFRLAISAISDLKYERYEPYAEIGEYDANYAKLIVEKICKNNYNIDILMKYYTGVNSNCFTPDDVNILPRSGSEDNYAVIAVKRLNGNYLLIVSYHNDKLPFVYNENDAITKHLSVDSESIVKSYNKKPLIFSYTIR